MRKAFETGAEQGRLVSVSLLVDADGYYIDTSTDKRFSALMVHFNDPDSAGRELSTRAAARRGGSRVKAVVVNYPDIPPTND